MNGHPVVCSCKTVCRIEADASDEGDEGDEICFVIPLQPGV